MKVCVHGISGMSKSAINWLWHLNRTFKQICIIIVAFTKGASVAELDLLPVGSCPPRYLNYLHIHLSFKGKRCNDSLLMEHSSSQGMVGSYHLLLSERP